MPLQRVDHGRVLVDVIQRQRHQQDARSGRGAQVPPLQQALPVDRGTLRVVAYLVDRRADQHQVPGRGRHDIVGEAAHDTGHVLEPVPAGDLDQHRITGPGAALADDVRGPGDHVHIPVAAHEPRGHHRRRAVQHAQLDQDGPHGVSGEGLVFRGERVDRRRDDPGLRDGDPRRDVFPAREYVRLCGGQVRSQEPPRRPGHIVLPVHTDVAAPYHPGAHPRQRRGQPGGLRVMQQHHVTGPDPGRQLRRVRGQHARVMAGLCRTERGAGQAAVDLIVQPLGDREEISVAADHQPADRDAQILYVPDENLQHLGHPATGRGRVDVPDGAPGQDGPDTPGLPSQVLKPPGTDDGLQPVDRFPRHLHRMHQAHEMRL